MSNKQALILDCNGQLKPAICFNLEIAGIDTRVVTDEDEAINLLSNSRLTGECFSELLVNNPYLNVDITKIVEDVKNIDIDLPVIFIKESKSLKLIVQSLNAEYSRPRLFHTEPIGIVEMLTKLRSRAEVLDNNQKQVS